MFVYDADQNYQPVVLQYLRTIGVDCRLPKKSRPKENKKSTPASQIFNKPLQDQKTTDTKLRSGVTLPIPSFLVEACNFVEKSLDTEGIYRKVGSLTRQREATTQLNKGKPLPANLQVLDVCNLLKKFLASLPTPLLPVGYHDTFVKCVRQGGPQPQTEALLVATLLLPERHLASLAYLMEHFKEVSKYEESNRMNVSSLSTIIVETVMPTPNVSSKNCRLHHHIKVIEILMENCDRIGIVPSVIINFTVHQTDGKPAEKRKKRSNSVFNGIKKMVGSKSSLHDGDNLPGTSQAAKRKSTDSGLGQKTGPTNLKRARSRSSSPNKKKLFMKRTSSECFHDQKSRQQLLQKKLSKTKLPTTTELPKSALQRRLSFWKKRSSLDSPRPSGSTFFLDNPDHATVVPRRSLNINSTKFDSIPSQENNEEDFVKIPKQEYEAIKKRVSALENRISQEFNNFNDRDQEEDLVINNSESVQIEYEKTLEETGGFDTSAADHLAKRFGRELNIRKSLEHKIIRSPSARKIGTIRRRSRELEKRVLRSISSPEFREIKTNLKRGRPNTVKTGLPSPGSVRVSSQSDLTDDTFLDSELEWRNSIPNSPLPQSSAFNRQSILQLRSQNAGMVLAKTKLFNSLDSSSESDSRSMDHSGKTSIDENVRRMSARLQQSPTRRTSSKKSPNSGKKAKHSKENISLIRQEEVLHHIQRRVSPLQYHNKVTTTLAPKIHQLAVQCAAERPTPAIKKPLNIRSPSSLAKTPGSFQRCRATPMKALIDSVGTPHRELRRSPRLLAIMNCRKL